VESRVGSLDVRMTTVGNGDVHLQSNYYFVKLIASVPSFELRH